jgi:hydrogenase maturation protease
MKVVAFALGNVLRADDGAGAALARGLGALVPGLHVVEAQELLPEHADEVVGAAGVLFLDASVAGSPGEVRAAQLVARPAREALLHALLPEELLGLAHAIHGRAPPAALVTIAGRSFAFGEALSPEVEAALPEAREKARQLAALFV